MHLRIAQLFILLFAGLFLHAEIAVGQNSANVASIFRTILELKDYTFKIIQLQN